jgi:hypothetical protein
MAREPVHRRGGTAACIRSRPLVVRASAVTLFRMAAELKTHDGQQFVGERGVAARAEPLIKRRRQHGRRDCLIDRGLYQSFG